jgi:hypothetical protein
VEKKLKEITFYTSLLAVIASFFSISVFQGLFALALILSIPLWFKHFKETFTGKFLTIPLLGHLSVITLASLLFLRVKEQWRRLIEQDFFSFTYFVPFLWEKEKLERFLNWVAVGSLFAGLLLSLKLFYSYYFQHYIKGFWGGNFIIGNLLALTFFYALTLIFKKQSKLLKLFALLVLILSAVAVALPAERSVLLGFVFSILLYTVAVFSLLSKKWKLILTGILSVSLLTGGYFVYKQPKVQYWLHLIQKEGINERTLNSVSSGRVGIAKSAWELVEKAWKERDYIKFLIGWGYGPQKQYKNAPGYHKQVLNEYESFVFLTEFINGGLINIIFILWFYIASFVLTLKVLRNRDSKLYLLKVSTLSAFWVNMIYHLFTLFWVPINAVYLLLFAVVEKLDKSEG